MSRIGIAIIWALHFLPLAAIAAIGNAIGSAAFWLIPERRRVTRINLKKCFPAMSVAERERIARAQGDAASPAGRQLLALGAQRDLIKQQLSEANAAADRARALREDRKRIGEDLATETHLTTMRENLSSMHAPFDSTDPAATIDEMRGRIGSAGGFSTDARVAEADRELASERARARVDDMLAQYKQGLTSDQSQPAGRPGTPTTTPDAEARQSDDETAAQSKTLGRTDGPVRPID